MWEVTRCEISLISLLSMWLSLLLHFANSRLKLCSKSTYFFSWSLSESANMVLRRTAWSFVSCYRHELAWTSKTSISSWQIVHSGNSSTGSYSASISPTSFLFTWELACLLSSTCLFCSPIFVTEAFAALPPLVHFCHKSCWFFCCYYCFWIFFAFVS